MFITNGTPEPSLRPANFNTLKVCILTGPDDGNENTVAVFSLSVKIS